MELIECWRAAFASQIGTKKPGQWSLQSKHKKRKPCYASLRESNKIAGNKLPDAAQVLDTFRI
jgi:hypothetical protein